MKKGTWSNSVQLLRETWGVIRRHKELVVFPVISGIASILLIGAIMAPAVFLSGLAGGEFDRQWVFYAFLFLFYFVTSFVVIFMNTGLISCAQVILQGGDPSISDGFSVAFQHVGKIAVWALINASVGMVLRTIRERGGIIGSILAGLVSVAWNLITFFVIPVIIFQGYGVMDSIKESASVFKRTWGENVVARFSIGLIFFLLGCAAVAPIALAVLTGQAAVIIVVAAAVLLYWVALAIISATLTGILSTALYDYATTEQVPPAFTPQTITAAFAQKPAGRMRGSR